MPHRFIAACDGATKGNPGPSAWAWVLADPDGTVLRWRSGPLGHATNNIAELTALKELLAEIGPEDEVEARLDSTYTINSVTKWLPAWKKNGWMTAGKKPVANADLIREIDALLATRKVRFVHVLAHQGANGDKLNDLADRAASATAISQQAMHGTSAAEVPNSPDTPGNGKPNKPITIKAKFAGTCSCGRPYEAGDKITKGAGGRWGHPECAG